MPATSVITLLDKITSADVELEFKKTPFAPQPPVLFCFMSLIKFLVTVAPFITPDKRIPLIVEEEDVLELTPNIVLELIVAFCAF